VDSALITHLQRYRPKIGQGRGSPAYRVLAMKPSSNGLPNEKQLQQMPYEELIANLEAITSKMASGEIGIEEATDLYATAKMIYKMASDRLESIRLRIEELEEESQ